MRKLINALFVGLLGGLLLVGTAYAHAAYLRSQPEAEAVIATPPTRVDIWFEQELFRRQGDNTIRVTSSDGSLVSVGETSIDDDDRTHIWVDIQAGLPAGKYLVTWKNVSLEDGHPSTGDFSFTLDPKAQVTSTPVLKPSDDSNKPLTLPAPTKAPSTSSPVSWPCAAGTLPALGLFGFVLVQNFRKK